MEKECVPPKYKNTPRLQKTEKFPTLPKPYDTKQHTFYSGGVITRKLIPYTLYIIIALFFAFHAVRLRSQLPYLYRVVYKWS